MMGPVLLVLIVATGLALLSIGAVEQNEYGLLYNWITKTIGNEVFHGGTHWIGFWNSFVTFPATVRTVEFSDRYGFRTAEMLHTRTKEGLGLHLSIAFQYKLNPREIPKLYALTNVMYEGLFTRIARDQLLVAAAEYEGPQYWLQRKEIGDHMRRLVDMQLKQSYASLWGLQLMIIDLPDTYEKSITMTQVQQQLIRTRGNEQIAASIRADTEVIEAQFRRDIQVVKADAQANYTLETKLASAEATKRKLTAEAEAIGYVRKKLELTPIGTVEYAQLAAYGAMENATFLANVPGALPMLGLGGATAKGPGLLQRGRASRRATSLQPGGSNGNAVATADISQTDPAIAKAKKQEQAVMSFFHENAPAEQIPSA